MEVTVFWIEGGVVWEELGESKEYDQTILYENYLK